MIDLGEEELIKFYNKHTFEELIPILKSSLEMGILEEEENDIIAIWTAGQSEDEYMVDCLTDFRCKHHYNYIGTVHAVSYFMKDKDNIFDYDYKIVAEPNFKRVD